MEFHRKPLVIEHGSAVEGLPGCEARDFLDTLHVHETVLSLGALVWAAAGSDPGFTPLLLLSMLRRRGRYRSEDFDRLMLREPVNLVLLKEKWLGAIEQVETFASGRPPEELGCLYYSLDLQRFVSRFTDQEGVVRPHFGRPGGGTTLRRRAAVAPTLYTLGV